MTLASFRLAAAQRHPGGHAAGPRDQALLLVEHVILPGNAPQFGKLLDLAMLAFPGGRERTATEWDELLHASGFTLTRIIPTEAALSLIQAAPRL